MTSREIDECLVEVRLEREIVRWEEMVRGTCRFRGRWSATQFTSVEVRLQVPSVEGQVVVLDRAPVIWPDMEIPAGEVVERSFEMRVPPRAGLGPAASVVVNLQRPHIWMPATLHVPVQLIPSRCFTDVLELTARLTGLRPQEWRIGALGDGVRTRLVPDLDQPKRVDALQLELHRANGMIYGHLIVDPVNIGFAGTLKNLTATDLIRLPIRFAEGDLDDASQQFARHLRPFLDAGAQLPIPASAGAQAEALPIPTNEAAPASEALPRPVHATDEDA